MKLIVLAGPCGSGKSTRAAELVEASANTVVVARDDLRKPGDDEALLSKRLLVVATSFLTRGISCIIDSPNVHEHDRIRWETIAVVMGADFEWEYMSASMGTCIARDAERANPVGPDVIREQFSALNDANLAAVIRDAEAAMGKRAGD